MSAKVVDSREPEGRLQRLSLLAEEELPRAALRFARSLQARWHFREGDKIVARKRVMVNDALAHYEVAAGILKELRGFEFRSREGSHQALSDAKANKSKMSPEEWQRTCMFLKKEAIGLLSEPFWKGPSLCSLVEERLTRLRTVKEIVALTRDSGVWD